MKKVLAFVLVLAMVLGSVSMAFADTTKYADDAAITNKEAVGVLSGLKVLEGDANGFRPADTLTRAEAAAILARLLLGRDDADKLTASAALFTDVPANHWAAGYIAYCVSQGIIAGNGDGTFSPDGVLTVTAFGKMLLCALGYDAQIEGLIGSSWEANTAALMVKANIAVSGTGACTRDTAALMALKTLEADLVEYASKGVSVNTGNAQVVVGGSAASKPAYADTYKYNNVADGIEQLAERVYKGKLIKTAKATDDFGRPGSNWVYTDSVAGSYVGDIGTFGKSVAKTFTGKLTAAQVNTELSGYKMESDAGLVNINNTTKTSQAAFAATAAAMQINSSVAAVKTTFAAVVTTAAVGQTLADAISGITGDGKVVELYADSGVIKNIVIFEYTVAKVSSVTAGSKRTSYSLSTGDSGYVYTDGTKDSDTVVLAGAVAKNDYVTYYKNGTKLYLFPTTKVTGEQTSYTNGSSHFTIVLDGTTYTVGKAVDNYSSAAFQTNNSDVTVYVDQYGFAVYSSSAENTEYAFILEAFAKEGKDNYGKTSYTPNVKVLLADGTVADYTIATKTVSKETVLKTLTNVPLTTNGGVDAYATGAAVVGALAGKVVTYTISDGKLDIKGILGEDGNGTALNTSGIAITSYSTTKFASKIATAGSVAVTGEIKSGTTKYESAAKTSLTNSDSKFVIYNTDKKTAATYTTVPKIAAGKVASSNDFVVVYKQDTINNVVVAFVKTNGSVQGSSSSYAYIKSNAAVTQTKSGDDTIYSVAGFDANGEEITITRTNDDFTGFLATTVAIDANNVFVDGYVADGGLVATSTSAIVSGNILQIGSTYYNITDKTATVLVDSNATKVNGNKVVIVLDDKSTDKLDILTIYVYGSNEAD